MAEDGGVRIIFTVLPRRVAGTDPSSPEALRVRTLAERILEKAIGHIGTRYSGQHPERGQRLHESGKIITNGVAQTVIFDHPAARFVTKGTAGHSIGSPGKILSNRHSPSRSSGGTFFARGIVSHPGTQPNPFLQKAVQDVGGTVRSGALKRGTAGPFPVVRAGSFT